MELTEIVVHPYAKNIKFAKRTYRDRRKQPQYFGVGLYLHGEYQYLLDSDPFGTPAVFGDKVKADEFIEETGQYFAEEPGEECRVVGVNIDVIRK